MKKHTFSMILPLGIHSAGSVKFHEKSHIFKIFSLKLFREFEMRWKHFTLWLQAFVCSSKYSEDIIFSTKQTSRSFDTSNGLYETKHELTVIFHFHAPWVVHFHMWNPWKMCHFWIDFWYPLREKNCCAAIVICFETIWTSKTCSRGTSYPYNIPECAW